jgi:hypothetical protein
MIFSRRHFLSCLIVTLLAAGVPRRAGAQAASFLSVIDDLPLMPGLTEDLEAAMTFDSAGGRIAEARAQGTLSAKAVRSFYHETLPQLGWRVRAQGGYMRGTETLRLEIEQQPEGQQLKRVSVRFVLRPSSS